MLQMDLTKSIDLGLGGTSEWGSVKILLPASRFCHPGHVAHGDELC